LLLRGMSKPVKAKRNKSGSQTISRWIFNAELSPNVSECSASDLRRMVTSLAARRQQDVYTIKMLLDGPITTDGSGNYSATVADNPSSDATWAAAAAFFDEYRVLAVSYKFSPMVTSGGSLLMYAPIIAVTDYDSSAALTGYTLASSYSSAKEFKGNSGWTYIAYMSGLENGSFISTASPSAHYYIKLYSSGNSASTVIGRAQIVHYVQFRGKGI